MEDFVGARQRIQRSFVAVTAFWVLLAVSGGCAAADWWAVHTQNRPLEYVFKPATLLVLIAAAAALDPADSTVRAWFLVALGFSLLGDVFLMLPTDRFVLGLASFLVGHLAYIVGLQVGDQSGTGLAVGVAVVVAALAVLGPRIVRGAAATDRKLVGPVVVYMVAISAMVASAFGATNAWAVAGALSFYASDALIAWNRFIHAYPWGRLAIIVTYHLGQAGLVISLLA